MRGVIVWTLSVLLGFLAGEVAWAETSPWERWSYLTLDDSRPGRAFGLLAADVDGDGDRDLIAGAFLYRNPGGLMIPPWERILIAEGVDAMLALDVDGDRYADLIAEALPTIYWCEATTEDARRWALRAVARIPPTGHRNGQGYPPCRSNGRRAPRGSSLRRRWPLRSRGARAA
ncbi:MAG: hypothetical protein KatS3mg115_1433 [Candidatus Poribacteria bacterium]|nr:MAG: hypothetical protein KatS3mg115_1433 [Candidatus Poribacteria bacterium]